MRGATRTRTKWLRRVVAAAVAAAVVVAIASVIRQDDRSRTVTVTIAEANNVIAGQLIREGGTRVGSVSAVRSVPLRGGRGAEIVFSIDDDAWPLPEGSTLRLRWGGTVRFGDRYFALTRGSRSGRPYADGARLPAGAVKAPLEFDQLLGLVDRPVQRDLRSLLNNGGRTVKRARRSISAALDAAPPALDQAVLLLRQLNRNRAAIQGLVSSGSRVLDAVDRAEPGVDELLSGARTTLTALASEQAGLRRTLDAAPGTLRLAQGTLGRADPVLARTGAVVRRLGPGLRGVRRLVSPLNHALLTATKVVPEATETVRIAEAATGQLDPLVDEVQERAPQLESIGRDADEALECVRPYTPEIAAFASTWSGFLSGYDGTDRYARVNPQVLPFAPVNIMGYGSSTVSKLFPHVRFGFPRPPGTTAGQPWLLPECGAGASAMDPNQDPEDRTR